MYVFCIILSLFSAKYFVAKDMTPVGLRYPLSILISRMIFSHDNLSDEPIMVDRREG
jgi:hypothetical protein